MIAVVLERVVLAASALVLIVVGAGAAFAPDAFYSSYGIDAGSSPELGSELRATGLALLLLGLAVASGAVWRRWAFPASVVAAVVLGGYALGRGLSALVDGVPLPAVVAAGVVELMLAAAAIGLVVRTRPRNT